MFDNSKRQTTPLPALDTASTLSSTLVGREISWELSCPLARQSLIDKAEAARLSNAQLDAAALITQTRPHRLYALIRRYPPSRCDSLTDRQTSRRPNDVVMTGYTVLCIETVSSHCCPCRQDPPPSSRHSCGCLKLNWFFWKQNVACNNLVRLTFYTTNFKEIFYKLIQISWLVTI